MSAEKLANAANTTGTKAFLIRQENKQCAKSPTYSELLAFWRLHSEEYYRQKQDQLKPLGDSVEESLSKLSTAVEKLGTLASTDPPAG